MRLLHWPLARPLLSITTVDSTAVGAHRFGLTVEDLGRRAAASEPRVRAAQARLDEIVRQRG